MRLLTDEDIEHLTLGATLLGTGGGGDPYVARLMVHQAVEDFGRVRLVDVAELPSNGLVLTVAMIGAPTVVIEKIPSGPELIGAITALAEHIGREPVAVMPIEVGGLNTLMPLAVAAELGLPVVDADGMRRAFPQLEMTVFTLAGIPASPICIADEKGNQIVFSATDNSTAERLVRGSVVTLGMSTAISSYAMSVEEVAAHAINGSVTYCMEIGRRLARIQSGAAGAFEDLLEFTGGRRLFAGKVIDLVRETTAGFARGTLVLEHLDDPQRTLRVEIQNELLVAFEDGRPVITPPDLICILDHENAQTLTTETLAYGQRLDVLALPCAPEWQQPGLLELVGPRAFGYEVDYVQIGGVEA